MKTRAMDYSSLKALFRQWPKLQLAVDESQIKWRRRGLRAIEHLPVAVTR
jgi:cytochrome P450 PksS